MILFGSALIFISWIRIRIKNTESEPNLLQLKIYKN
jgi:hypothetical protein